MRKLFGPIRLGVAMEPKFKKILRVVLLLFTMKPSYIFGGWVIDYPTTAQ